VTAEDNVISGGFGSAVLEALAPVGLAGKVRVMALPDEFLPQGKPVDILSRHGLDPAGLAGAAREAVRAASPKTFG
jgi:1-deoxy-D-xylulose-5-phosphate synthase